MTTLFASLLLAGGMVRGPMPILSTPYFADGSVDYESLAAQTKFVAKWCPGVIWGQSSDSIDLVTYDERLKAFDTCAATVEGSTVTLALGANGTNTAHMLEIAAAIERTADRHPTSHIAIISRPPNDARSEEDIERAWDALGAVVRRPVIFQTRLELCLRPMGEDVKLFDTFIYHHIRAYPRLRFAVLRDRTRGTRCAVMCSYVQ